MQTPSLRAFSRSDRSANRVFALRRASADARTAMLEPLESRCLLSATYTVTNANDSGTGSLRQAILDANAHTTTATIDFAIAKKGLQTITPKTDLPALTASNVTIAGGSQSTFEHESAASPEIQINGSADGNLIGFGIGILGSDDAMSGLQIVGFKDVGIEIVKSHGDVISSCVVSGNGEVNIVIEQSNDNTVKGTFVGTNAAGTDAMKNVGGIQILDGSSDNVIGSKSPNAMNSASANVISGNSIGVQIHDKNPSMFGNCHGNVVAGNLIGTDVTGNFIVSNITGIELDELGKSNTIGLASDGNLISGNSDNGIDLEYGGNSVIQGNLIGTDISGNARLPNGEHGIYMYQSSGNLIGPKSGGATSGGANTISGNMVGGIIIDHSSNNTVAGNRIGVNITGKFAVVNYDDGIDLDGSGYNVIGLPGDGNVISGNNLYGIAVNSSKSVVIQGNFIGTDIAGSAKIPNGMNGINLPDTSNSKANLIGSNNGAGAGSSSANTISGNNADGIYIGASCTGNTIAGNRIGVNAAGTGSLGNGLDGIEAVSASNNLIGIAKDGNIISGNGTNGIAMEGASKITVQGNFIGTNLAGSAKLPNGDDGIKLSADANNNLIGNTTGGAGAASANVISGNHVNGVDLASSTGNTIAGNRIGIVASGKSALGNSNAGIELDAGADSNFIGLANNGNILSGNVIGVLIKGAKTNTIKGNFIGLDMTGTFAIANHYGIELEKKATGNIVGAFSFGAPNYIAGNSIDGVLLSDAGTSGNLVNINNFSENTGGKSVPNVLHDILYINGATS